MTTPRRRQLGELLRRWRYAFLVLLAASWFTRQYAAHYANHPKIGGDWLWFKVGAFTLQHWDRDFATPRLHLYADLPQLQIGPPSLWLVAALQTILPIWMATLTCAILMCAAGLLVVGLLESSAVRLNPQLDTGRRSATVLVGGSLVVAAFADNAATWRHLDDVLALTGIALSIWLITRGNRWWLVAAVLGTAVAAKPWAIAAAPLLLGLPQRDRARGTLAFLVAAAAWWIPFVAAAPATIGSLGGLQLLPRTGSALFVMGFRADQSQWLRPTQFVAGVAVALIIGRRVHWTAAAPTGLAVLVVLSPYAWSYYGMAAVMAGLLADLLLNSSRVPLWTVAAGLAMYLTPLVLPGSVCGALRLVWPVSLVVWLAGRPIRGAVKSRPASTAGSRTTRTSTA